MGFSRSKGQSLQWVFRTIDQAGSKPPFRQRILTKYGTPQRAGKRPRQYKLFVSLILFTRSNYDRQSDLRTPATEVEIGSPLDWRYASLRCRRCSAFARIDTGRTYARQAGCRAPVGF